MKKIRIDKYTVREKGRTYEILKFPFIKHMWAFDDYPEEDMFMVDGCKEAFMWLKYAFAVLANDSGKIIYFPCRQEGIGRYYAMPTYDLVLCRPELQLRRSLWFRIRRKLDKKHYTGKYVLAYNRRKLDDYYESGLGKKYQMEEGYNGRTYLPYYLRRQKKNVERILGDTMFVVLSRIEWLVYHHNTAEDLDDYRSSKGSMIWSAIGWIISDGELEDMYRIVEEEEKERQKELEEFREEIYIPELEV